MAAGRKKTRGRSERIVGLEAAVESLREELRVALAHVQAGRTATMRESSRCPACGGAKVLHFRHVKDVLHGKTVDLALQHEVSRFWGTVISAGPLEAFACRSCRFVEWYAISLEDVEVDGDDVVELEAPPAQSPDGPYR